MSAFIPGFQAGSPIPLDPGEVFILPADVRPMPMPTPDVLTPVGDLPLGDAVNDGGVTVKPLPGFGILPGEIVGSPGIAIVIGGGSGDDVLELQAGGTAFGGGGADVFVLSSAGVEGLENLGLITDFGADDSLDLSRLGEAATILDRTEQDGGRGERISIDYDGDGKADGCVTVFDGQAPDVSAYAPMPMPTPEFGAVTIELRAEPVDIDLGSLSIAVPRLLSLDGWIA